jgi:hypothetical protein
MITAMEIRDSVQEVWTDNGKQFVSAEFQAMLDSALPGVRHRQTPEYAAYASLVRAKASDIQVLRAVMAETLIDDLQELCALTMTKINSSSPDDGPSPFLLWTQKSSHR